MTNAVCLDIKSSRHGHICHLGTFDTALTSLNSLVGLLLNLCFYIFLDNIKQNDACLQTRSIIRFILRS